VTTQSEPIINTAIKNNAISDLNKLAKIQEELKSLHAESESIIGNALLNNPDLNAEYNKTDAKINELKTMESVIIDEIKSGVVLLKESVKGSTLHAVYNKGKTSWDTKGLEGYSLAHPEINIMKKIGEPSISIRQISERKTE
jgi:hypothetical protein